MTITYAEYITQDRNRIAKALEEQCQQLVEVAAKREELHRQTKELAAALNEVCTVALDALGTDRVREDRLEAQRIIKAIQSRLPRQA
jgi:hypothetical protein